MCKVVDINLSDPNLIWNILDTTSEEKFRETNTYYMYHPGSYQKVDVTEIMKTLAEICEYQMLTTSLFCSLQHSVITQINPLVFELKNSRKLEVGSNRRVRLLIGDEVKYSIGSTHIDAFELIQSFLFGY